MCRPKPQNAKKDSQWTELVRRNTKYQIQKNATPGYVCQEYRYSLTPDIHTTLFGKNTVTSCKLICVRAIHYRQLTGINFYRQQLLLSRLLQYQPRLLGYRYPRQDV